MKWFLKKANGGDVLVLRASGSDGYNDYMYSKLGISINSVETIVFNDASASKDEYIHNKIQKAEAIWIAGGNQWNYISYWRNTKINSLINKGIKDRNIAIGGTSAGMAIMGGFYFSAQYGTVTSSTALSNPYDKTVTVDSTRFLNNNILSNTITDTHYDNRNRKGRHTTFLARILVDYGIKAKGIACDETISVCIQNNGQAIVYGDYPKSENKAYFIQTNGTFNDLLPKTCAENSLLDWNIGAETLKVYAVYGTMDGVNTFNLTDWKTGHGGLWEQWHIDNGLLKIIKEQKYKQH